MKKHRFIKKLLSVIISVFIFNSFVINDIIYANFQIQPTAIVSQFEKIIDSDFATITDSFVSPVNDKELLVFIQDLHTNPTVQKNISKTLELLDNLYGIDRIYLEGLPSGKANMDLLMALKEYNIDDNLLSKNIISGTEYYFLKNDTTSQIYGMEDWEKYFSNVKRAARILQDQEYLEQYYDEFKQTLFSKVKNIKKIEKNIEFNLTDDKLLGKINQPILQYGELHKYISLSENIKNIDIKKIKKEHTLFVNNLKKDLPLSEYKNIVNLSKREDLKDYFSKLYENLNKNNDYKFKYENLTNFLNFTLQKFTLNTINFTHQKNKYFDDYLSSITNDKLQQDLFVVKMTILFHDFITLAISEQDYDFFINNYQKYINLLPHYLANDYERYTDLLFSDTDIIFDYHDINKSRNADFIKNISSFLQNKTNSNKVTVVIAGGFHSSILKRLQKENLSYLIVTPKIEGITDSSFYDEIILSSISSNKIETNALAPIRELLLDSKFSNPETKEQFYNELFSVLIDKLNENQNISPEELKNILTEKIRKTFIMNIPSIKIDITDSNFTISIGGSKIIYKVKDNNVLFKTVSTKYKSIQAINLKSQIKKKLNTLEITSLTINPKSKHSSSFIPRRVGQRINLMFSFSMFFSSIITPIQRLNEMFYDWAYDLMIGFASLEKAKSTAITIDFNEDFGDDIKKLKVFSSFKDKSLKIIIENGLSKYLTKEDILNILANSIGRLDTQAIDFKKTIFIGYLDKSTTLFEGHVHNGFIGINSGIFQIQDEVVKKALLQAGIIHELTHKFKGAFNTAKYTEFEERMMLCDIKYLIEYVAKDKYGKNIDPYADEDKYQQIIQEITNILTESTDERNIPLFEKNISFIRKLKGYKYTIEKIVEFVKRKNFTEYRNGQLKHIENEYLKDNPQAQEYLFSRLPIFREKELSMTEFLKTHISQKRMDEVERLISKLVENYRESLGRIYPNDPLDYKDKNTELFKKYIYECLDLMYRRMPDYLFGAYYNEQGVIADHALNHSIEVLHNMLDIMEPTKKYDTEALAYSAFMHDISCTLTRIDHEQNSATFAKAMLKTDKKSEEKIDKIYNICLGHKKIKGEILRKEHEKFVEAQLLHDADGLSAVLALDRILGVWLTTKETFFNRKLSVDERIRLIKENKYLMTDGGDAINDLIRQFLRRDEKYYITDKAKVLIKTKSKASELTDFLEKPEVRTAIKNAGIIEADRVDGIAAINMVLDKIRPKDIEEGKDKADKNIKFFGIKEKLKLLKQLVSLFFNKDKAFDKNIVLSDVHGGYKNFVKLIMDFIEPNLDITNKTDDEINNIITEGLRKLSGDTQLYLLGDILDRGPGQVETFELVKEMIKTGKMRFVMGNHDIYAFMNLLGLHLPTYENYKGISADYTDFKGNNILDLLKILLSEDRRQILPDGHKYENPRTQGFWAEKFCYYMQYAQEQQDKYWNKKEKEMNNLFTETFNVDLDQVLNNTNFVNNLITTPKQLTYLFSDPKFIDFHKKFFGRNVGIKVYTGIRAVNKMSINWWLDREKELKYLTKTYPQYAQYWKQIYDVINDIITRQKDQYNSQEAGNNLSWAIIDAIMYRNYESTEWHALDWAYHEKWGGGKEGFLNRINENQVSYLKSFILNDLLNFYHENFSLHEFDNYGICYMHAILPVDDEGDIALGYVDEKTGVFHEFDSDGKRIKGFIYKGKHYKGKNIFKGLNEIAEDIRNYDISSGELYKIREALTLLTAIYADNLTRIKPENLKEMRQFGFGEILKKQGITTIVTGHNPIEKIGYQFEYEYTTLRFFNKDFKYINTIQVDGNMVGGKGLRTEIGGNIISRGFFDNSMQITKSFLPDVPADIFINTIILNAFPLLRNILFVTEKIYDAYNFLKQKILFGSIKVNKKNTSIIRVVESKKDFQSVEKEHIKGIKNIILVPSEVVYNSDEGNNIYLIDNNEQEKEETIKIEGVPVKIRVRLHSVKVAKGHIPVITYSYMYDKDSFVIDEQIIQNGVIEHIIDQINNSVYSDIKPTKNMFVNSSINNLFDNASMTAIATKIFGPLLYDTRSKRTISITDSLSSKINIDKIKDVLAAA